MNILTECMATHIGIHSYLDVMKVSNEEILCAYMKIRVHNTVATEHFA